MRSRIVENERLIMAIAGVFVVLALVLGIVGIVYAQFVIAVALMFGVVAFLMWYQASGRLASRIYEGVEARARVNDRWRRRNENQRQQEKRWQQRNRRWGNGNFDPRNSWTGQSTNTHNRQKRREQPDESTTQPREAYAILGLAPDAEEEEIKKAYRDRVKEVHPDTKGGDEEAFKRVTAAYEQLTETHDTNY